MNKIIFTLLLGISFNMSAQTTYTVTSASVTGTGSFTEAIGLANANPGADIIEFTDGLQVDASVPSVGPSTSIMAKITESVVIDGKGGALNGIQTWIDSSGRLNPLGECPGFVPNTLQLAYMPGFVEIGTYGADNTGIDVSIKNLTIKQFNQVAEIYKNASLVLENFEAYDTWSTYQCSKVVMIEAREGVSLTITDSKFSGAENWSLADASASIYGADAADLTIERSQFSDLCKRDQPAIYWDGASGSEVNIVSSNIVRSGGIRVLGESVSNIVNSIWVNYYFQAPAIGDRIINSSNGDMNIIASSFVWNSNECDLLCQANLYQNLFEIKGAGDINFSESAVGFNFDAGVSEDELNTLGINGGTGAFTADVYTWIQPTTQQDAAALKTMTSQPSLLTDLFGFNREVIGVTGNWDVEMVTPAFPGELIDVIPAGNPLINPIDGLPITLDVVGNPREDANGKRDIGALQLALAPFLGVSGSGDAYVDLNWNEPLHHDGLTIIRYEVVYDVTGGSSPTTVTIDPPVLSKTISGLTNGTEYEFQVRAVYTGPVNGPYSNTVKETPLGPIGTPMVTAVPGNAEVALSWNLPDLGGRDFSLYIFQWRIEGTTDFMGAQTFNNPAETNTTVTGLVNGTTYEFVVKVYASGEFSNPGFATATPDALPIALCQPFTAELEANGTVTILPSDVDGGSSDPDGPVTLSLDNDSFTCADIGPNTVTLTVTDNNNPNSTATCTATVTVEDNIAPVIGCPGDVTATTENGECGAIVNFQNAEATDNCGSVVVYQTAGFASGSVFPIGDTLIEFTAEDDSGNLSTCTFTITVEDDDDPDAVCQNITVQLDEFGVATITANQINFGSSDNCGVDTLEIDIDTFGCSDVGENTVTLTVTDVNGNVSTCTSTVTVEDVTPPEITCNDITVELGADGTVTVDPMDIAAGSSDACGIATYELNIDTFSCLDVGNSTVILTVTDVNGNQSSCSATVTVEDNTAPVLVCMDVTLELNEDGVAFITPALVADIIDNCGTGVVTIDVGEVSCTDIGTPVTVNVFANDGNGNSSFCSSTVMVVDTLGPQIVCPEDETVNLDPNGTYTLGDYIGDGIATATDNCTDPVTIFTQDPAAGTLLGFGVHVITFTAEDEYGNVSTCSFELDVEEILGANDTKDFASLVLYPNPADSKVHLSNPRQIDLSDVTIYDLTGRMVNKIDLTNMGSEITIDVSTLANTTYMLVIRGSQGISNKQLIVNN